MSHWNGNKRKHKSNDKSDLTTGSMPIVEKNLWLILDDFFPMECMFNLEIRRVNVLSSSLLYLSTAKKWTRLISSLKLQYLMKWPSLVAPLFLICMLTLESLCIPVLGWGVLCMRTLPNCLRIFRVDGLITNIFSIE